MPIWRVNSLTESTAAHNLKDDLAASHWQKSTILRCLHCMLSGSLKLFNMDHQTEIHSYKRIKTDRTTWTTAHCQTTDKKTETTITEHSEISSSRILSRLTERMTSILSFILFDQRSKVDHSKVAVNLEPVLKFMVSRTEHWSLISIL